jgi:hypothetical protein
MLTDETWNCTKNKELLKTYEYSINTEGKKNEDECLIFT